MASQTDDRTTLQSIVREIYILNNPLPPISDIEGRLRWGETHNSTIQQLQSSVGDGQAYLLANEHYPASKKSVLPLNVFQTSIFPGMTLHYPILVRSEEMIPTSFRINGNPDIPDGGDVTYQIGSNLKESLGFPDQIIIGPEASIDNVFTTVNISLPPEQEPTPAASAAITPGPCWDGFVTIQRQYSYYSLIDGDGNSGKPGRNSVVKSKYVEMIYNESDNEWRPNGRIITTFYDNIGLFNNDGIKYYKMYGNWKKNIRNEWFLLDSEAPEGSKFLEEGCNYRWDAKGARLVR